MSVSLFGPSEALRRFVDAAREAPAEPYRSLEPFRFADAGILAARDAEIERLVRLVTMYRGVLLYGESGSGKTSLVNAGALPRLTEDGFWPHRVRVQPRPGEELALEPISSSDTADAAFLPSAFAGADEHGRLVLATSEFEAAVKSAAERGSILLVFDQFEELVTLFPEASKLTDTQRSILKAIVSLLRQRHLGVKMLFSFREDYLASLRPLLEEQPELAHQSVRLASPPQECAEEIIRAPFERFPRAFGRELSPQLAERIASSLARRSDRQDLNLSELQIVCRRLLAAGDPWALLDARGIGGLLEDHLNEALDRFPPNVHVAAIAILSQMITPRGTRNVIAEPDLVRRAVEEEGLEVSLLDEAIGRLEKESRLIRRERRHDLDLFELTSEFLIPWISQRRGEVQEARRRRRERRRIIILGAIIGAVLGAAAIVSVLAIVAFQQKHSAQEQRVKATYLGLASRAQALLDTRPDVSLLLALESYRQRPPAVSNTLAVSSLLSAFERLWRSGVTGILHGHTDSVTSVAFDPDSSMLASAGGDATVRFWDTGTRRQLGTQLRDSVGPVFSVAFSPSGRMLASGLQNGAVQLWDVARRRPLGEPLPVDPGAAATDVGSVIAVAFSPNGRMLGAADLDGRLRVWTIGSDGAVGKSIVLSQPSSVRTIAFSPDSRALAAGENNDHLILWDLATRRITTTKVGTPVYSVAFNPNSRTLAAGGLDGKVFVWNLVSPRATEFATGNGSAINGLAFSYDGRRMACATADGAVELWNLDSRQRVPQVLAGHTGIVTSVAFSRHGDILASASADRTIRLWDPNSPPRFGAPLAPAQNWIPVKAIDTVAFASSTDTVAAANSDREKTHTVRLWAVGSQTPLAQLITGHAGIRSVALSPDGHALITTSQTGTVQIWNIAPRKLQARTIFTNTAGNVFGSAFSPNGRTVAFSGSGGALALADAKSGWQVHKLKTTSGAAVFHVAFSSDGSTLASAGDDRRIRLWNVASGREARVLTGHTDAVFAVAFAPHGPMLASGGADDTVRLWDVSNGDAVGQPLTGHHDYVRSVAFSPDGGTLASGSRDAAIRLWDVASRTQIGDALGDSGQSIESVAFSPDGNVLVSGGTDGTVRIWPGVLLPHSYIALRRKVCGLVGEGLSNQEWSRYAPEFHPHDSCR